MDPLSVTVSVVSIATFALQSCKAAHELVDRLTGAPKVIAHSKQLLSETQSILEGLKDTLTSGSADRRPRFCPAEDKARHRSQSTQGVCDEFGETIKGLPKHSTDSRFSNRDRLTVSFHESKISRFNQQLGNARALYR